MRHHLSIDIETKSSIDIGKAGLYKYAQSPDFAILLFAYKWDDDPVQIVDLATGEILSVGIKEPKKIRIRSNTHITQPLNGTV